MTASLRASSLTDLLDALASSDPAPGGGAATALTGGIGVSLLLMVAAMNRTRTGAPEELTDLAAAAARLRPLRDELIALMDIDREAYTQVIAAYRLPKETDEDKAARREAVATAMRGAIESPLRTMRACVGALRECPRIAAIGNPNAVGDAAVGRELLSAALRAAGMNVEINVQGLSDAAFAAASATERRALEDEARRLSA